MKTSTIDSSVLAGQGGGGSRLVSVPNPAPGVGQMAGDKSLSTEVQVGPAPVNSGGLAPKGGEKP